MCCAVHAYASWLSCCAVLLCWAAWDVPCWPGLTWKWHRRLALQAMPAVQGRSPTQPLPCLPACQEWAPSCLADPPTNCSVRRVHGLMVLSMTAPREAVRQMLPYVLPSVATEALVRCGRLLLCWVRVMLQGRVGPLFGRKRRWHCGVVTSAHGVCVVYAGRLGRRRPALLVWPCLNCSWGACRPTSPAAALQPTCPAAALPTHLPSCCPPPCSGDWQLPLMAAGRALQGMAVFYAGCQAEVREAKGQHSLGRDCTGPHFYSGCQAGMRAPYGRGKQFGCNACMPIC